MKKLIVSGTLCAVAALGGAGVASAEETTASTTTTTTTTTTTSQAAMLAKIQELMKLIASLQEQINAAKGEIQELAVDLDLGAKNDDVLKAQELLASDPTLLGVKPTGYFGPMTQEALKKFQERYGLEVTGKLDEATRDVMKELRKERKDGRVPAGLVNSGEVKDRILAKLKMKWNEKHSDDDMDDDMDEDEDMDDDSSDDDSDDDSSSDATRAEAEEALGDAREAISDLKLSIDEMDEDEDKDAIRDAKKDLIKAQKKLADARRTFIKGEYDDVVEKAEEVVELSSGDDSDDSSDDEDDEDEDEDDDK